MACYYLYAKLQKPSNSLYLSFSFPTIKAKWVTLLHIRTCTKELFLIKLEDAKLFVTSWSSSMVYE